MTGFDTSVDVLIVGSGAGALTAALTAQKGGADVLVVEKSAEYGGTSATSGGGIWIPNSHYAKAQGVDDSREDALTYLKAVVGPVVDEKRLEAYVDEAPRMLKYMADNTRLEYSPVAYSDYYPEQPGGKQGFRTHEPVPMSARKLGWNIFNKLRPQHRQTIVQGRFTMTMAEGRSFLTQADGWKQTLTKMMMGYYLDLPARMKGKRSRRLTLGNALVGRLLWSAKDTKLPIWLETPFKELIEENGKVVGAVVEKDGKPHRVEARKGVILGAGGFEHNNEMREQWLPQPTSSEWSGSQKNNTGDAIEAGRKIGAALDMMDSAWWAPAIKVPGIERPWVLFAERSSPGMVMVNKAGRRFSNEAAPYLDNGYAMYNNPEEAESVPAYLVFDATFRKKYPLGPLPPGYAGGDAVLPSKVKEILTIADTIEELAEKIGVDAEGLKDTIAKNNEYAVAGHDPDYHRGDSFYDQYYGDQRNGPNKCIAPIEKAPFYCVPVYPGDIGTKGGLLVDEKSRVLREDGTVIGGLYAIGNTSASVMGRTYPGAGVTIGPAMTFGYVAARDAVGMN